MTKRQATYRLLISTAWHRRCIVAIAPLLFAVAPYAEQSVKAQAAAFLPFTGTAEVTYTQLPQYNLPSMATVYAGHHKLLVHFSVRDRLHFRVDIQTVSPAIDSGVLTVVERGTSILSYDTRTETAGVAQQTPVRLPPAWKKYLSNYLLSYFMNGQAPIVGGAELYPAQTTAQYVALVQKQLSARYPPEYPKSYAKLIGQDTILGHPVDVVEYGPIWQDDYVTGCSFSHPGRCIHHYSSAGIQRLWIDRNHPFILQALQQGMNDPHSLKTPAINASYRVTDISYGTGPSNKDLSYRPPVPVVHTKNWSILATGGSLNSGGGQIQSVPQGFRYLSPPSDVTNLSVNEGVFELERGPRKKVTAIDILYSSGKHVTTYLHPGDRYGFGLYVKGPYMYVQERVQVHGLPDALKAGTPRAAAGCSVWTGTYPNQQHWLALAKGRISFQIVSNVLSESRLVTYVGKSLCSK